MESLDYIQVKMDAMRRAQRRFGFAILAMFLVVVGLECGRLFVLDAKVTRLVRRLNQCEVRTGYVSPMEERKK